MTGHRSLAETDAKLDLSEVKNWAVGGQRLSSARMSDKHTSLWIKFHLAWVACMKVGEGQQKPLLGKAGHESGESLN